MMRNTVIWVKDGSNGIQPDLKVELNVDDPVSVLRKKIMETMEYGDENFSLSFKNFVITPDDKETTLEDLGFTPGGVRNNVTLMKSEDNKEKNTNHDLDSKDSDDKSDGDKNMAVVPYYGPGYGPGYNYSSSSTNTVSTASAGYSSASSYGNYYNYSYSYNYYNQGRNTTGFVGLSNQGATCYMNSLIQSLYMTPEFRRGVYQWSFEEKYKRDKEKEREKKLRAENAAEHTNGHTNDETTVVNHHDGNGDKAVDEKVAKQRVSIPLQLQLLFARLQTSDVQSVKTKDLTRSFGWNESDAFTQHDVQELCRVLFDALEKNFAGTEQANLVNELYQGTMKDYVKCRECNHESAREDHFLDVPLVIRGFGETKAVSSIEEAFGKFVQVESLEGDNQYYCERCQKKVDAEKGLKFVHFPYILSLQLKRFDYDFQLMRRIKLNDEVTFPLVLDLNPFVNGNTAPMPNNNNNNNSNTTNNNNNNNNNNHTHTNNNSSTTHSDAPSPPISNGAESVPNSGYDSDTMPELTEGKEPEAPQQKKRKEKEIEEPQPTVIEKNLRGPFPHPTDDCPYVYELFSVLIHKGSSMGGHYYAYIRDFEKQKWYEFNDSLVTEIKVEEIAKGFGGEEPVSTSYYGGLYSKAFVSYRSSANAYMLLYRKIDVTKNQNPPPSIEIPQSVKNLIEEEELEIKRKREQEEAEREMVRLKIHYQTNEKNLVLSKTTTLSEATRLAADLYNLSSSFPPDCIRLRLYQAYHDIPQDTYTGKEHLGLAALGLHNPYSSRSMLLETRQPDEEFLEYDPSRTFLKVSKFDPITSRFEQPIAVYMGKDSTLGDLKTLLEPKFNISIAKQRIFKEGYTTVEELRPPDNMPISSYRVYDASKLFVEEDQDEIDDNNEESNSPYGMRKESRAAKEMERIRNLIEVTFTLPGKEQPLPEHKLTVDKNLKYGELKKLLQPYLGLDLNEFKVFRGVSTWKTELKDEDEPLHECYVRTGSVLFTEKGTPMKKGEVACTVFLFDGSKEGEDPFTELFNLPVPETYLIFDLLVILHKKLKEEKGIEAISPNHLRIREMWSRCVNKTYLPHKTLRENMRYNYPEKTLAVQVLKEPDTIKDDKELVVFIQVFDPATYTLGERAEVIVNEDWTMDELNRWVSERTEIPIQDIGLARVANNHYVTDILEIPELEWDRKPSPYQSRHTVGTSPLYLKDGELLLIRNNSIQLKQLSKEEKDALEKEANNKKKISTQNTFSLWTRKEKALKIHTDEGEA